MKPSKTELEIRKSERRIRIGSALGLAAGKAATIAGRKKDRRSLRVAGRLVFGFSVLAALTAAFHAFVKWNEAELVEIPLKQPVPDSVLRAEAGQA